VGTKRQAQDAIAEEAQRCSMYYVNQRWLGGLLTNWITVQKSVKRLKELDEMATDGRYDLLPKKEVIKLERERKHLQANLAGIKNMTRLPDAIFVIDSNKEQIAVRESRKLGIPVVAVVDTNCDPSEVDYVIPGNDDALRAIRLFTSKISESIAEGVHARDDKQMADIQAVAEPETAVADPAAEELFAAVAADGATAAPAGVDGAGLDAAAPEGEEIRMEDVLGKGTRKRPSPATEDVDELQAETRRF
jgi:small subunit ribosomal protein S2